MNAEFPFHGLLPKEETEALNFIKKNPKCDGRNVRIAILDTGVDPGAAGLKVTSDGKPKLVDIIDCNGSGDVVMTVAPKLNEDGTLTGISGRNLKLNKSWNCPTGEYFLGLKKAFDFFPKPLVSRLKSERAKKRAVSEARLLESCQSAILEWSSKHPDLSKAEISHLEEKTNIQAKRDALKDLIKDYDDIGPIYDVIVFHDGSDWLAAIDTLESGDLSQSTAMKDYAKDNCFGTISEEDKLNYSFKFYGFETNEDQKIVSIVTNSGSHGTHVACIVAANFPQNPELNGVAPGAQLVSLKIGETRLGSMETGTALSRAFIEIVRLKCDLVNISYGEAPNIPDYGHFVDQLKDLALKHNVVVMSSAGNGGPALSTVGCPGGTSSYIIGVGAYVTPAMMKAEYALLESVNAMPYTWSSQAPAYDGHIGVHIYAPGGAITSVPNWTLQPNQLMNGTSMSSPSACGCVGLIVSSLKSKGLSFTPMRIKRAIMNSAKSIDMESFGRGLLQVEKSIAYLDQHKSFVDNDVFFEVSVSGSDRGIYIRDAETCKRSKVISNIQVQPKFMEDIKNEVKVSFEMHLALVCTESWIKAPSFLQLNNGGRAFQVEIDPSALVPGLNVGYVHAFDSQNVARGPIFEVPVTIAKPEPPINLRFDKMNLNLVSGKKSRFFFEIPRNASFAEIKIWADNLETPARFAFHSNQIIIGKRYANTEVQTYFTLDSAQDSYEKVIQVTGGTPLEICICPFWSSRGKSTLSFSMSLDGVSCDASMLFASSGYKRVAVTSLASSAIKPSISLSKLVRYIRHDDKDPILIKPLLSDRDTLPNGQRVLQMILNYSFSVGTTATATPMFSPFSGHLYDIPAESFLYQVFDKNKKVLSFGDVYGSGVSLQSGDYLIKVEIRHESLSFLEKLCSSVVLSLVYSLGKDVSVPIYKDLKGLLDQEGKVTKAISFTRDEETHFYVPTTGILSSDEESRLLNDFKAESSDSLQGFISFGMGAKSVGSASKEKVSFFPVAYHLSGIRKPASVKEYPDASAKDAKSPERVLFEGVRDARVQSLNFEKATDSTSIAWTWLKDEYEKDLVFLSAFLRKLDRIDVVNDLVLKKNAEPFKHHDILKDIVFRIRSQIDKKALAEYFGTNNVVKWSDQSALEKADISLQKDILVESTVRYMKSLYAQNKFDLWREEMSELKKWVDVSSSDDAFIIHFLDCLLNERFGSAIKDVLERRKKKAEASKGDNPLKLQEKQLNSLVVFLLEKNGWVEYGNWFKMKLLFDYPLSYATF